MSVRVEQPLHLSQHPSSPPFSSPPQSPSHLLHAQPPATTPRPPPVDVDMSSSVTTIAPAGQQHDREDADMADSVSLANSEVQMPPIVAGDREPADTVAIEVAVVDDDAMDTTPDTDTGLLQSSHPTESLDAATTPTSPPTNEDVVGDQPDNNDPILPVGAPNDEVSLAECLG
jgi:hypothetical protein